jgi:hypothetical protein
MKFSDFMKDAVRGLKAHDEVTLRTEGGAWGDTQRSLLVRRKGATSPTPLAEIPIREVDFRDADMKYLDMCGADLSGLNLAGADLTGAKLRWANLSGSDLTGSDLSMVEAERALFNNASMLWAMLGGAQLAGTFFRNTILSYAGFRAASLRETSFVGADLFSVDFVMADIDRADLTGANASKIKLAGASIRNVLGPGSVTFHNWTTQGHPLRVVQRQDAHPLATAGCTQETLPKMRQIVEGDIWPSGADDVTRERNRPRMLAVLDAVAVLAELWPDVRELDGSLR